MICSSIPTFTVLLALLTTTCEKSSVLQGRSISAQNPANDRSAGVDNDSELNRENAVFVANQKLAEAQADFMNTREAYRHKIFAGLVNLNGKVLSLERKVRHLSGKGKNELESNLTQIRVDRDAFMHDCKSVDAATSTNWVATTVRLDKEWAELTNLVD